MLQRTAVFLDNEECTSLADIDTVPCVIEGLAAAVAECLKDVKSVKGDLRDEIRSAAENDITGVALYKISCNTDCR